MTRRLHVAVLLKLALIVVAWTALTAQTLLAGQQQRAAGYGGNRNDSALSAIAIVEKVSTKKRSIKKDRCDEKPRPSDCDVRK